MPNEVVVGLMKTFFKDQKKMVVLLAAINGRQ
jgi:hypothetical protein